MLWELADLLVDLGADAALNLDGGWAAVVTPRPQGARNHPPGHLKAEDQHTGH
jgi:hypothetical protein